MVLTLINWVVLCSIAIFGSPERPLKIGKQEIPAYVLEDGTRVLVQRGMMMALGMAIGGGRVRSPEDRAQAGNKLVQFAQTKALEPYISKEFLARAQNPIKFKLPNGAGALGYEATMLPDICNAAICSAIMAL